MAGVSTGHTRARVFGSDTPFCAWMRGCTDLPAAGDPKFGFSSSDNDLTVHRYKTEVDGIGSREVQAIMQIEIKTNRGEPRFAQMDTLGKLNWFAGLKKRNDQWVHFFGVFLLVLSGTTPDNSRQMWWGRLPKREPLSGAGDIRWAKVTREQLIRLLRFDIHPRTFEPRLFRRHHLTREVMVVERLPLGFSSPRKLVTRS